MIAKALSRLVLLAGVALVLYLAVVAVNGTRVALSGSASESSRAHSALASRGVLARGRRIFRFDTFGDQAFWGGALRLHRAIAGKANGGVGPGVSPKAALSVGLREPGSRTSATGAT